MLGGFNSVKRENHHYKYAFCTNNDDIKRIYSDYKKDLTADNAWTYCLTSLVTGKDAFKDATISRFEGDLSNLKTVDRMFNGCKSLKTWNVELPNLTNGSYMFDTCSISNWDIELPNLTNGNYMFCKCPLSKWDIELPTLQTAYCMYKGCSSLSEFNVNLPKLTDARYMFDLSPLIYFSGNISTLSNGQSMFNGCILNKQSVSNIINSIPTYTSGSHPITIGIHVDNRYDEEISSIIAEGTTKGWTVTTQWNGNPTKNEVISPEKIAKLELDSIILPYGYRRCEYLESDTNNQYIDTEIIPTNTTGTWVIAKRITDSVDGFSIAVRTNSNYYYPPMLRSNGNYHGWGTTTEWTDFTKQNTAFESYINYPINGTITKEAVAIDNAGTSVTKALTTELPTISHSLYIFGRNHNGTLERQWNGRIYRVKISEGDQIIRDFIPALDPDGKPCMYEMIEGKAYYNAATTGNDFLYKVYEDYVMPELPPYDIVEGSKYIPDASSWNSTAYAELTAEDKIIIKVVNGIAYDE